MVATWNVSPFLQTLDPANTFILPLGMYLLTTALIGRLRHRQNIDSFSIVDFVVFTIINDNYYGARKNCFACLLFKKPMHADLNDIISCLIKH